jgi:uncharacterized protein YjbI with pentapeptide repeats
VKRSQTRWTLGLVVAAMVLPFVVEEGATSAGSTCPSQSRDAAELAAALAAGSPIVLHDVTIRGDLRLPANTDAPLVLRSSCVRGDLVGANGSFSRVLDLSDSTIRGRVDFDGARFDAPVTFEGAELEGDSSFVLAVFGEAAHFGGADFDRLADFSGAEFHGSASFSAASWQRLADFSGTSFARRADFAAAHFDGAGGDEPSVDFSRATYDDGATFLLATVEGRAEFHLATSSGDLSFQSVSIHGTAVPAGEDTLYFSTVRFLAPVSFSDAAIHGRVSFDRADVSELDLAGASLDGDLRLPIGPASKGRLGALRLDLDDADHVVGPAGGDDRRAQEAALELVESSARATDDLETANDARVRRLEIARQRKSMPLRSIDTAFTYGLWGYGVRPFHQLIAIAVVLALCAGVRWGSRLSARPKAGGRVRGAFADIGESLGSLLRLHPPEGAWSVAEYLVFKILVVVFVLNAANVWPVSRDLIQGIF